MPEDQYVVDGARLICFNCIDSMLRNGPPLKVISQTTYKENGKPVATKYDIGESIPPFTCCDILGNCTPDVKMTWQDTKYDMGIPKLIVGQSFTYCEAGQGILITATSGQSPSEEMTREQEIENVYQWLKQINEWARQQDEWGVAKLSERQLREAAAEYVDAMRAFEKMKRDKNGYVNLWEMDPKAQNALFHMAGSMSGYDMMGNPTYDINHFITRHGVLTDYETDFMNINGKTIGLFAMDYAMQNSWKKNLAISAGAVGALAVGLSAPLWGPALIGVLKTGASAALSFTIPTLPTLIGGSGGAVLAGGMITVTISGQTVILAGASAVFGGAMLMAKGKGSGGMGQSHGGTPGNNQAQNKQVDDICKRVGLDKYQRRLLHDEITGQGYSYDEILEIAKEIKQFYKGGR